MNRPDAVEKPLEDALIMSALALYEDTLQQQTVRKHGIVARWERLLQLAPDRDVWLPTVALCILTHLCRLWPDARVLFSDFDSFPASKRRVSGFNAPIVQRKQRDDESIPTDAVVDPPAPNHQSSNERNAARNDGVNMNSSARTEEFDSLLDAPFGECDIMFQTDFTMLSGALQSLGARPLAVASHRAFLSKHAASLPELTQQVMTGGSGVVSRFLPMLDDFSNVSFAWSSDH